jgi:hypothetical protein
VCSDTKPNLLKIPSETGSPWYGLVTRVSQVQGLKRFDSRPGGDGYLGGCRPPELVGPRSAGNGSGRNVALG